MIVMTTPNKYLYQCRLYKNCLWHKWFKYWIKLYEWSQQTKNMLQKTNHQWIKSSTTSLSKIKNPLKKWMGCLQQWVSNYLKHNKDKIND